MDKKSLTKLKTAPNGVKYWKMLEGLGDGQYFVGRLYEDGEVEGSNTFAPLKGWEKLPVKGEIYYY